MANFFSRFKKRWANGGVIAEPTDVQADNGFSFLGNNPPSLELFNALLQQFDEKDNWLYSQITEFMIANGVTPTASDLQGMLKAFRNTTRGGMIVYDAFTIQTSGGVFIVPDNVYAVRVVCVGGGGGGGGSYNPNGAGAGGGGGGYAEMICTVTPKQAIAIVCGAGGRGAPQNNPAGATAGGVTAFGNFASATGGGAGGGGVGAVGTVGGAPGLGYCDGLRQGGTAGGLGQLYGGPSGTYGGYNMGGGMGGGAGYGSSSLSHLSIGGSGNAGIFPGGGGGGAGMPSTAGPQWSYPGGDGASGSLRIEWNI